MITQGKSVSNKHNVILPRRFLWTVKYMSPSYEAISQTKLVQFLGL